MTKSAKNSTVTHLARLMDRARLAGDVALYCDLQAQMAQVLSA